MGVNPVDLPTANYLILSSRLIPGLDGGFTVATLARARLLASAGASPLLLTVDPGTPEDHEAQRAEFGGRGLADPSRMRNLFDEALADPSWLIAAAVPGSAAEGLEYREFRTASGELVLSLPVIVGDPDWHLSTAPVLVHAAEGIRTVPGFGGLYRAWLDHVIAGLDGPSVLICESRQLGELLVPWDAPAVPIVHTIHTAHLELPRTPDAPVNALWARWFDVVERFDAVLWPTRRQQGDVVARFGEHPGYVVAPNAAPAVVSAVAPVTQPPRVVSLSRLAPGKRIDHALRAWPRVLQAVPEALLEIYGDGPERASLQHLIEGLGLEASVSLLGPTDAGPAVFDGAAAMVQTSAFEGQGLSVLEALSRGCPVVAYDVRYGPAEILGSGGGVLVADADETALAGALIAVLTDPALQQRLAGEALEAARAYAPERVLEGLAAVMRSVLPA